MTEEESKAIARELGHRMLAMTKDQPVTAGVAAVSAVLSAMLQSNPNRDVILANLVTGIHQLWRGEV
jgi:hypothetical protein